MQLIERAREAYKESKVMPYLKFIIGIILAILGLQIVFTYLPDLLTSAPFKMHSPLILISAFCLSGLIDIMDFLEMSPDATKKEVKSKIINMVANFVIAFAILLYAIIFL